MIETNTGNVLTVAFGAQGAAKPALVALDNPLDYDDPTPGVWTLKAFKFAEDDVEITPLDDKLYVDAPEDQAAERAFIFKNGIDTIAFGSYEIGARPYSHSSTMSVAGQVYTETKLITYRSMIVEYTGVGFLYLPKVMVQIGPPKGGVKKIANCTFSIKAFRTNAIPAASDWNEFT